MEDLIQKLDSVVRVIGDFKSLRDALLSEIQKIQQKKSDLEITLAGLEKRYVRMSDDIGKYWSEFESKKKEEHSILEKLKKEAHLLFEDSTKKAADAVKNSEAAKNLERVWQDKLKEIEAVKQELLEKKEKAKELISHIG